MFSGKPCITGSGYFQTIVQHCNGTLFIPDTIRNSPLGPAVLKAVALKRLEDDLLGGEGEEQSENDEEAELHVWKKVTS